MGGGGIHRFYLWIMEITLQHSWPCNASSIRASKLPQAFHGCKSHRRADFKRCYAIRSWYYQQNNNNNTNYWLLTEHTAAQMQTCCIIFCHVLSCLQHFFLHWLSHPAASTHEACIINIIVMIHDGKDTAGWTVHQTRLCLNLDCTLFVFI